MKAEISIFKCLDDLRNHHNIRDGAWAKASNDIRRPTISEMRRLLKTPNIKIGRSCTIEKLSALYDGLLHLIGGEELKKHLEECLKTEPNQNARLLMLAMALRESDRAGKDLIESTMRMVLKVNDPTKK
jgi:hypothetical protein